MKTIKFRPLRVIKKTGKITVASYLTWRRVATNDYGKFNLVISDEHKRMGKSELVHNHNGELLYFYDYHPADVPVFHYSPISELFDLDKIRENNKQYGIIWSNSDHINYRMDGADCDGIPTFSHLTEKHITQHYRDFSDFKPLTVEVVCKWYGWILWQLNNSKLVQS